MAHFHYSFVVVAFLCKNYIYLYYFFHTTYTYLHFPPSVCTRMFMEDGNYHL